MDARVQTLIRLSKPSLELVPPLRCVHVVLDEDALCFHTSPVGAKIAGVGRRAVAAVERVLAVVPWYAFDPERARPATLPALEHCHGLQK